jgi:hypothetical protein
VNIEDAAFMATEWTLPRDIRICKIQYEKGFWFAVRDNYGRVFGKSGYWRDEPLPSSRTDEFYDEFRFQTFENAYVAAQGASK